MRMIPGRATWAATVWLLPGVLSAQTLHVRDDADVNLDAKAGSGRQQRILVGDFPRVRSSLKGWDAAGRRIGLVRFDLTPLPSSISVARASLQLWVRKLHRPGTLDVVAVGEPWSESDVSGEAPPSLGARVGSITIGGGDELRYVVVDVTQAVRDWLSGALPEHGFALLSGGDGTLRVELDSKENVLTSHAAELVVVPDGVAGTPGPPGPPGPPGSPLVSFDALAGLPCDLAGSPGVLKIRYLHKGLVVLQCVQGPACTDADGDGFFAQLGCGTAADCNDTNAAIHPGATEICGDGLDNDCDGQTDEGCTPACVDLDGDGYFGSAGCGTSVDCNDANASIHPGATDVCSNGIDEDCTGADGDDADADGWSPCDGDCQESAGVVDPRLINPGAFEFVGDGLDNDCDPATSDAAQAVCSQAGKLTGVTAADLASAMDLCQSTTDSPPLAERKWGLLSAELLAADGSAPDAGRLSELQNFQAAALLNYGTGGVVPEVGATMAGLSTGRMRDANDPGYVAPNQGSDFGSAGQPPADYLAAHGGSLPSSAGCSGSCDSGAGAYDSVNLRLRIRVPTNARSLSYRYRFFSAEYWQYACTIYNDFHLALLQGTATGIPADRNIAFDSSGNVMSVNNANFDICQAKACYLCPLGTAALSGTGMDQVVDTPLPQDQGMTGGGTPWLNVTAPVVPGETITLDLMIFDVTDNILDSLVLLDGFSWLP